nr:hypothetical protein HK105_005947 [Polyrhizophydium stewartii]
MPKDAAAAAAGRPAGRAEPLVCTVCLDPVSASVPLPPAASVPAPLRQHLSQLCILKCRHLFHSACIVRWLGAGSRSVCPNCRTTVAAQDGSLDLVFLPDGLVAPEPSPPSPPNIKLGPDRLRSPPPDCKPDPDELLRRQQQQPSQARRPAQSDMLALLHRDLAAKQALVDELQDIVESMRFELEDAVTESELHATVAERLEESRRLFEQRAAADAAALVESQRACKALAAENARLAQAARASEAAAEASRIDAAAASARAEAVLASAAAATRRLNAYAAIEAVDSREFGDEEWEAKAADAVAGGDVEELRQIIFAYHSPGLGY